MKLVLASSSPRRAKILRSLGVDFTVKTGDAREISLPGEPERTVAENARAKAASVPDAAALAADTIVWLDGRIFGKPRDAAEAKEYLRLLSGRTHTVFTGVSFRGDTCVEKSLVKIRNLSDADIDGYVAAVNPVDRAGAYDIDESGSKIVERYFGSYENIMGLPVEPLAEWGIVESRPVGFFDSGYGGLSVLKEFWRLRPDEDTLYLADRKNCPYGNKPPREILDISLANTEKLLSRGAKVVVVACNTATAAAIDTLRESYPSTPFVGIEPAIKPAALESKTGIVGVLATAGTLNGSLYARTKGKFASGTRVVAAVADEFVEIVESKRMEDLLYGTVEWTDGEYETVERAVSPLVSAGCDMIALGCTHFPHLKPLIEKVCAGKAKVIDTSAAVARRIANVLDERSLSSHPSRRPVRCFV